MAFSSARQRFLDQASPAQPEPAVTVAAIAAVLDLVRTKNVEALLKKAQDAVKTLADTERLTEDLEASQAKAEAGVEAARLEIAKLESAHDAAVSKDRAALALA